MTLIFFLFKNSFFKFFFNGYKSFVKFTFDIISVSIKFSYDFLIMFLDFIFYCSFETNFFVKLIDDNCESEYF